MYSVFYPRLDTQGMNRPRRQDAILTFERARPMRGRGRLYRIPEQETIVAAHTSKQASPAGTGAIVGGQTGHAGAGTAIGAGLGALGGALIGEGQRRQKENIKKEMRQEMMQQQYQPQYAPQPYYGTAPQPQQPYAQATAPQGAPGQEVHTKYNPRTGQTFPERYKFDPNTGEELKYLR